MGKRQNNGARTDQAHEKATKCTGSVMRDSIENKKSTKKPWQYKDPPKKEHGPGPTEITAAGAADIALFAINGLISRRRG